MGAKDNTFVGQGPFRAKGPATPSVVPGPEASASPGNWLEIQNRSSTPDVFFFFENVVFEQHLIPGDSDTH